MYNFIIDLPISKAFVNGVQIAYKQQDILHLIAKINSLKYNLGIINIVSQPEDKVQILLITDANNKIEYFIVNNLELQPELDNFISSIIIKQNEENNI